MAVSRDGRIRPGLTISANVYMISIWRYFLAPNTINLNSSLTPRNTFHTPTRWERSPTIKVLHMQADHIE
jgi:hypothetical protein